jgi:hypothetical protein
MGGKSAVVKGKAWEQEVARELTRVGIKHERILRESRDANVGDVTSKQEPEIPIAVVKRDRQTPVVVLSWEDFLDLYYYVCGDEPWSVGFLVQCKVGKQPPVMPAYRQAVEAFDAAAK